MKIFIEVPTWLGDTIMTTPAIENIIQTYPDATLTLFGSFVSTQALQAHPHVESIIEDKSRKKGFRLLNLYRQAKSLGTYEIALSFRRTLTSKLFLSMIQAKEKHQYRRYTQTAMHQVERYNLFIQKALHIKLHAGKLKLYTDKKSFAKPTLGLNPGATYGSAKRWDASRFAKVATVLANRYDILIFGSPAETEMAEEIEKILRDNHISNFTNLAGKTTISELLSHIGGLDLFITNDSGPMHVAAAYQIPTVAIFGPTKHHETSQWMNPSSQIVRHDLECAPCMKRTCPLKTDACMDAVTTQDVLDAIQRIEDAS